MWGSDFNQHILLSLVSNMSACSSIAYLRSWQLVLEKTLITNEISFPDSFIKCKKLLKQKQKLNKCLFKDWNSAFLFFLGVSASKREGGSSLKLFSWNSHWLNVFIKGRWLRFFSPLRDSDLHLLLHIIPFPTMEISTFIFACSCLYF